MSGLAAFSLRLLRAGRGRALPLFLLGLAGLALDHFAATPLSSLRQAQFDRYQRQMPRLRDSQPAVVVGIDSESLARHGQWPWPRDEIARLLDRIQAGKPLAVGFDIFFAEADRYSPAVLGQHLPALDAATLRRLPEPDERLAGALRQGNSVLAVSGVARPLPGTRLPQKPLRQLIDQTGASASVTRFSTGLSSLPLLEQAAGGEGLINASPDSLHDSVDRGILRRVPALAFIDEQPFLSLPLEMVRLALGGGEVVVEGGSQGMQAIRIGDYRLPTQPNGEVLVHFGQADAHYYLSAADVLAGKVPPESFSDRFVLVGFNTTGLQDRIVNPLGENLPGVDVHVQVIESLLAGTALRRPPWMAGIEIVVLFAAGFLLVAAIPVLRPRYAVYVYVALATAIVGGGHLAFQQGRWLFDGASIALLLTPMFIALLGNTLVAADARRRSAERELQSSREAEARITGELDAARRIQMGLLPDPATAFAGESRFAVAALLEPARAVGGDYYDCFMLDASRLCVAVGDVSGKGIPASLFMAISKTLTGTLARRHADLGEAMQAVEQELARENPEFLFVTAFVAVLDVDRGILDYVCAGHDAPLLLRGGEVFRVDTSAGGPPLCALGDFPYSGASMQLQPGDLLCLYTDGVTEAANGERLFGSERLFAALRELPETTPAAAVSSLRDAVRRFEAGEAPADDVTLLALCWQGKA